MSIEEIPVDWRWTCHKGHFLAYESVQSADFPDPGAYYGISTRTWADCAACGRVEEPSFVPTRWILRSADERS